MRKILVASTNPGKLKELREMLGGNIEWVSLSDFKNVPEIEEDGKTFAENARKKAIGYAKATDMWTLADDSGLVVDALGGEPGVKSARFSGVKDANRGLIDHKNMAKVLKLLESVPKEKRTARFMCCLCLAAPEKVLIETSGKLEGLIIDKPMGENGFGYDPIFFVPESNKTVAQMASVEKNAISHRGNAIRSLKHSLEQLL
jgi:XTP/dITP diphosphohydrolase